MPRQSQGPWIDLALHTLGWKAFQDLCGQVCEEILKRPVEVFREAQDGGQDGAYLSKNKNGHALATIQCKFSSNSTKRLKSGDISSELDSISSLIEAGASETYIFITSMGVDAPVALEIKRILLSLGIKKPHVFGKEFICKAIRSSSRLRALVPQVYGLGDLSLILDERKADQTKALLKNWLPTLKLYVPTASHRKAVKCLSENGIVLLLGNPATGKSTIAAILSAMACETGTQICFKLDGPKDFSEHWAPHEKNRFYWIDDAFGSNQLRDEYIHDWAENFRKIQAAISDGNRFVLTSRRHIYEDAKWRLGTRNLPLFSSESAIVNVGTLTPQEKQQILYNQIKAGGQPLYWRRAIKPHLETIAAEPRFLPGIAKRLADPTFTKGLRLTSEDLLKFFREPKEHLINTIGELSDIHQAALAAVFIHRGKMSVDTPDTGSIELVCNVFGIDKGKLNKALRELNMSFVVQIEEGGRKIWSFDHPTILDAITDTFRRHPEKAEMFVRGAKLEVVMTNVACGDAPLLEDALTIGKDLEPILINRISECPDEPAANHLLFSFLIRRASDAVFTGAARKMPSLFTREDKYYGHSGKGYDPKYRCIAKAHELGILSDQIRSSTAIELEVALLRYNDTSFLDDERMLALIQPRQLIRISSKIRTELINNLQKAADSVTSEPDLDVDPSDNFDEITSSIEHLRELFEDDAEMESKLTEVEDYVVGAIEEVSEKKEERDREREDDRHSDWNPIYARKIQNFGEASPRSQAPLNRSVFSDIDE